MDMRSDNSAIALAVDLDGTLIAGDLLHDAIFALIRKNPLYLFMFPVWLMAGGKARFKDEIFSRTETDAAHLVYREDVIDAIRAAKADGRTVVLATASGAKPARAVADHLGLFDEVITSTPTVNLRSSRKAEALVKRYGDAGFDYMGNSADDIKIFDAARHAVVVAPDKAARRWGRDNDADFLSENARPTFKDYLKMLRVHQWAKNTLIAVPAILDHSIFDPATLVSVVTAFFAFSFVASAIYIFNDLCDLPSDRRHATKRKRPLAAGRIQVAAGVRVMGALLAVAAVLTAMLPGWFAFVIGLYLLLTTAYSLRVKGFLLIDVLTLAGLYTVRVLAGAAATYTDPSFWLLAFSMFFFLSLALVKRFVELDQAEVGEKEKLVGRGYRPEDKETIAQAGMSSGFASVLVLALYLNNPTVYALYSAPWLIWPLCPLVLYIIIRIWILAQRREFNEDPVVFITTDWRSQVMIAIGASLILLATVAGDAFDFV